MYATTRLGRWFYEDLNPSSSSSAVIVLWHSFLCDGGMWDGQINELSRLGRVIVFDGPGHGKSEVPPPFSLDDNARALVDALETIAPGPVVMVGLSWGGMLAMRLALLEPARVRAMVLMDSNAEPEDRKVLPKYRAMLELSRHAGLPRWLVDRQVAPLMFGPRTLRDRTDVVDHFVADMNGFSREGVARAGKAIFWREDIVPKLAHIDTPTLVLCGRDDAATPLARSQTIAHGIAGSRLEVIDGAGHLSAVEQPAAVNRAIVPFVREHVLTS